LVRKINNTLIRILKLKKLQQVKFSLAISVSILFVILYFVITINTKNQRAFQSVTHSAEIITKLEEIYSRSNELESAHRGYIITNDSSYLDPYNRIESELNQYITDLQFLVRDNIKQSAISKTLKLHIQNQLSRIHQDSKAARYDKLKKSREGMSDVLLTIRAMKHLENMLMLERLSNSKLLANRNTIAIILAILFTTFFILSAAIILMNEYKLKSKIEEELLVSQQLLKDKVNALDASNKELEQFAYIASHDLQEPLRKIITFNERINQKLTTSIDPSIKDYFNRTINAAERMKILIDDLLEFSRVTRGEVEPSPVSLKSVIDTIKDNLELQIKKTHTKLIVHDPLPVIYGDKVHLVRLFQNILNNAIKFTAVGTRPVVEVFCTTADKKEIEQTPLLSPYNDYYKITVKDNGIGFDEEYKDKIFVIFQRLHGRSEYEGTGIGLSICKKIAEKYQGQITVKSEVGKGSEFYVYFPKKTL
jgi:signal transduction histidine kinase